MKLASFLSISSIQHAYALVVSSPFMKNSPDLYKRPRVNDIVERTSRFSSPHTHASPLNTSQRLKMAYRDGLLNTTSSSETGGHAAVSFKENTSIEDCLSLNVLLDIIAKITELDGTRNIFEGKNLLNLSEEASKLLEELAYRAANNMERGVGDVETQKEENDDNALAKNGLQAARFLRELMSYHGPAKGKGRKALISTISFMIDEQSPAKILAVVTVVAALALPRSSNHPVLDDDDHRSVSRAAVSGLLPNGRYQKNKNDFNEITSSARDNFGGEAVLALIGVVASASPTNGSPTNGEREVVIDLHIVTSLTRAFVSDRTPLASTCAACIRQTLSLEDKKFAEEISSQRAEVDKLDVTGALGLASELGPWSKISPVRLVEIAMDKYLWHAAERLCESAVKFNSPDSHEAVHTLIDGLSERHMYRQSDVIATAFYDNGGRSRYAEARCMHACETIAKVVMRRQFPILERQVGRVDKAFERVRKDNVGDEVDDNENGSEEVRVFALTKLREVNEHDAAHKLAQMWDMEYWYNENDSQKFIQARLERYIQWNDFFLDESSEIPEVLSSPDDLTESFNELVQTVESSLPVIGFDAEWGEDCKGVALLQLSTVEKAILIDVPALLRSVEGCDALEKTVGDLFAGRISKTTSIVAAGFSCREDISRLRASIGVRSSHWFTSTESFLDTKPIIAEDKPKLKNLGLSRVCEHYLGKPLDKAEQCSLWERRPLSTSQRTYAALDAWAVAAICSKLPIDAIVRVDDT